MKYSPMLFYSKASQKSVAQPNEKYMCSASGKMYDSLSWYYFSIVFLEAKIYFHWFIFIFVKRINIGTKSCTFVAKFLHRVIHVKSKFQSHYRKRASIISIVGNLGVLHLLIAMKLVGKCADPSFVAQMSFYKTYPINSRRS